MKILLADSQYIDLKQLAEVRVGLTQRWDYQPDAIIVSKDCTQVKDARGQYPCVPILVVSQDYHDDEVKYLFGLGIVDFLVNPTYISLIGAVKNALFRKPSRTSAHRNLEALSEFTKKAAKLQRKYQSQG